MAIISYLSEELYAGKVEGGEIYEIKPVGFPEEEGLLKGYSNIFYWSFLWTDKGGEISEHSLKGFEILTFVLEGEIEHYDSKYRGWRKLTAGDVQVIRSGNGFIHSERMMPGASLFRIWTDPDLEKSLNQPASWDNYPSDRFPISIEKGRSIKTYLGRGAPLDLQTGGLCIREISMAEGHHTYNCSRNVFISGFVMEGNLAVGKLKLEPHGFFIAKEEECFTITVLTDCRVFIVESPLDPGYPTYSDKYVI